MKKTLILMVLACVACLLAACAACAEVCPHPDVEFTNLGGGKHSKYCRTCQQTLVDSEQHTLTKTHANGAHNEKCTYCDYEEHMVDIFAYHYLMGAVHEARCQFPECGYVDMNEAHTLEISHPSVLGHYNHYEKCTKCTYSYTESGAAYSYTDTQHTLSCPAPNCPNNNKTEDHLIEYFRVNPDIHVKRCGICPYYKEENHPSLTIMHTADGKHLDICPLCGEANRFDNVFFEQASEWEHVVICDEGCNTFFTEAHDFAYTDNKDGKTHKMYCEKCNFNVVWELPVDHVYAYNQTPEGHEPYCTLCEYVADVEAHVIGTQYDKTHHWTSCVCGYGMKDKSEHVRIYSHIRARHIETCGGCDIRYVNLYMTQYTSDAKTHTVICSTTGCPMNGHTENHTGGEADCYNKAVCEVCLSEYGNYAHASYFETNNDGTHAEKCSICSGYLSDGQCSGGSATCALQAVCQVCNGPYGATRAHNYEQAYTSIGDEKHARMCAYTDCDEYTDAQSCAGGNATCQARAACDACGAIYGEIGAHSFKGEYMQASNDVHIQACDIENCGKVSITPCEGGAEATCLKRSVCVFCNGEYGELGAHDYQDTHALDTHYSECALCQDIPEASRVPLGWAELDGASHVRVCPVEGCEVLLDTQAHTLKRVCVNGDYHRDICAVCSAKLPVRKHNYKWQYDDNRHKGICAYCGYSAVKYAHVFDVWVSDENARHTCECAHCAAEFTKECEYFTFEAGENKYEICLICGDTLIDGARVSPCEYVEGAQMTSVDDTEIPNYARLRVFRFDLGYTIALEYQGGTLEPQNGIRVEIPMENAESIFIEATQNGIYALTP